MDIVLDIWQVRKGFASRNGSPLRVVHLAYEQEVTLFGNEVLPTFFRLFQRCLLPQSRTLLYLLFLHLYHSNDLLFELWGFFLYLIENTDWDSERLALVGVHFEYIAQSVQALFFKHLNHTAEVFIHRLAIVFEDITGDNAVCCVLTLTIQDNLLRLRLVHLPVGRLFSSLLLDELGTVVNAAHCILCAMIARVYTADSILMVEKISTMAAIRVSITDQ